MCTLLNYATSTAHASWQKHTFVFNYSSRFDSILVGLVYILRPTSPTYRLAFRALSTRVHPSFLTWRRHCEVAICCVELRCDMTVDGRSNVLSVRNFETCSAQQEVESCSADQEVDVRHYRVRCQHRNNNNKNNNDNNDDDDNNQLFYIVKTNTFPSINHLIAHYQRTYMLY